MLTEVPIEERAPILKAWGQVATSGRKHLPVANDAPVAAFETIAGKLPCLSHRPGRVAELGNTLGRSDSGRRVTPDPQLGS